MPPTLQWPTRLHTVWAPLCTCFNSLPNALSLTGSTPATLACLTYLEHTRHTPASLPLQLPFPLFQMPFPLHGSCLLDSKSSISVRPALATLPKIICFFPYSLYLFSQPYFSLALIAIYYIYFNILAFFIICFPPLECKAHDDKDFYLFRSLLSFLKQWLAYMVFSICCMNICLFQNSLRSANK